MPELVDNHITTHDIPRNSSVPCQRARRSVTVVVVCSTVTRFCFLWGVVFESGAQASAQIFIITGPHGTTRADATEEFKERVSRVCVFTPSMTHSINNSQPYQPTNVLRKPLWWMGVGGDDGGVLDLT